MSFKREEYSILHLRGNADVSASRFATLRAAIRRSNPDNTSNVPYYAGVNAKALRVTYTYMVGSDVTEATEDITIPSTSFATILDTINAVDPTNLSAIDMGGYLGLRNLNVGRTHFVRIEPYTTPSSDAAPLFGFVVAPYPGSSAYVGEVATTPGLEQSNPQGTVLIGQNEDFKGAAFNRALYALLEQVESGLVDLDAPVIGFKDLAVTFAVQGSSTQVYAPLAGLNARIPIFGTSNPVLHPQNRYIQINKTLSGLVPGPYFKQNTATNNATAPAWTYPTWEQANVLDVCYGEVASTPFSVTGDPIGAWGTLDGNSIYEETVPTLDKHEEVDISGFQGDIFYCEDADFVTAKVMPGDPVFLQAENFEPFDHTGWFSVKKVYDSKHISIRPMSPSERTPENNDEDVRPKAINIAGGGTLTVKVGWYVPTDDLFVITQNKVNPGAAVIRVACAVPLREALREDLVNNNEGVLNDVLGFLSTHISNGTASAHAAEGIRGFNAGTFADTTPLNYSAGNIKTLITDIVGFLASQSSGTGAGGSRKIGAAVVTLTGGSPTTYVGLDRSVAAGRIYDQLLELLTKLRDHEVDPIRHDASGIFTGYANSAVSSLSATIATGTCIADGRYWTSAQQVIACTDNAFTLIYVDGLDGVIKGTSIEPDKFVADANVPLFGILAQSGSIAEVIDMRRKQVASRKRGQVTVGASGCDFTSLKGAIFWLGQYRQVAGAPASFEVVIQGTTAVNKTIALNFPVIIRGTAIDGSSLSGGPLSRIVGTLAGQPMFRCAATVHGVVFKDLHCTVENTNSASCFFTNLDGGSTGDNWRFENCYFEGAPSGGYIFGLSPDSASSDWTWEKCVFQNRVGSGFYAYIGDNCTGYTFNGCKFLGGTDNANVQGISVFESAVETVFNNCVFDMGGIHINVTNTASSTRASNCRFRRSFSTSIYNISSGEVQLSNCLFTGCMTGSSNSFGVVMADTGSGSIQLDFCRFKTWGNLGYAVFATGNAGINWKITDCTFTTASANRLVCGLSGAVFSNNTVDLAPGASAGAGQGNIQPAFTFLNGCIISNNKILNCGSNGSANGDTVISIGDGNIVSGNSFSNCRGKFVSTTGKFNSVFGNVSLADRASVDDVGFLDGGKDNEEFSNKWPGHLSARTLQNHPLYRYHQNWSAPLLTSWLTETASGGTVTGLTDPTTLTPGRWLRLVCPGTVSGTGAAFKHSNVETFLSGPLRANVAAIIEFCTYSTTLGGSNCYFQTGLCTDEVNAPTTNDAILLTMPNGSSTWHLYTSGTSQTDVDSGVTVSNSLVQQHRIEIVGSTDPNGATVRLWINGVLVATSTTNLAIDQGMLLSTGIQNTTQTAGDITVYISPITFELKFIDRP